MRDLSFKRMLTWGLIIAVGLIAAIAVGTYVTQLNTKGTAGVTLYGGTQQMNQTQFYDFKAFVARSGSKLLEMHIANNTTEPITVSYLLEVPDGVQNPYGKAKGGMTEPMMLGFGAGFMTLVVTALIGATALRMKEQHRGFRTGRH